jgi:hypothetical protein
MHKLIEEIMDLKSEVSQLLNKLPDNCTIEDVQYHLYVIEKIRKGIESAESNGALDQKEVEKRLKKWRIK